MLPFSGFNYVHLPAASRKRSVIFSSGAEQQQLGDVSEI